MRVCSSPGCPELCDGPRCPVHQLVYERARGSRQARGYGAEHDRLRKKWAPYVATGSVICARCGQRIARNDLWDLDHKDDRSGYLGPTHSNRCNRAAGGRASHR